MSLRDPPSAPPRRQSPVLDRPEAVEAAFYAAFEGLDLGLMAALWLDAPESACVHPGGDPLIGYAAVIAGWRGILSGADQPTVRFRVIERHGSGDLAVHLVEERIGTAALPAEATRVLATNVYRRTGDGWRMLLHHATLPLTTRRGPPAEAAPTRMH